MKFFNVMLLLPLTTIGCTGPMDTKITKENYSDLVEQIRKDSAQEEWKKIEAIQMLARLGKMAGKSETDMLEGRTFNEVINDIKEKRELKAKAAQDEADHTTTLTNLFEQISWKKGVSVGLYGIQKKVRITLELRNLSDNCFDAFEGRIIVNDKLGNRLASWPIKETELLKAKEPRKMVYEFPTIDFQNKVNEIFNTKGSDLRFSFEATKVILANGTTL